MPTLSDLRNAYHARLCREIIRLQPDDQGGYPNFADKGNRASRAIAAEILRTLGCVPLSTNVAGQTAGGRFEQITRDLLEAAFGLLAHLRPGEWRYSTQVAILHFDQYAHIANLQRIVNQNEELASALGLDYVITPDIVVARLPVSDAEINRQGAVLSADAPIATLTPLREANGPGGGLPLLHASISCKWTLRSDRGQNARTEALNLVRNRKGPLPHIVAVTAEPLPSRIASLALGTGDLDCVYHIALPEVQQALLAVGNEDQQDMLALLVEGQRLRDISDLPFDLAA